MSCGRQRAGLSRLTAAPRPVILVAQNKALPEGQHSRATNSRSPLRTRDALSARLIQTFPSPIAPVCTHLRIASVTVATSSWGTSTLDSELRQQESFRVDGPKVPSVLVLLAEAAHLSRDESAGLSPGHRTHHVV